MCRLICENCSHARWDVLLKPQSPEEDLSVVHECFDRFVSSTGQSHCHSHHHLLWPPPETANSWADAKWSSERASGASIFTLRLMLVYVSVFENVCWKTATGLAVWKTALLLRNFSGGVQTLTSKSQTPHSPKRSRHVGRRRTSAVRSASGPKLLTILASYKTKALSTIASQLGGWLVQFAVIFQMCSMCLARHAALVNVDIFKKDSENLIVYIIEMYLLFIYFLMYTAYL